MITFYKNMNEYKKFIELNEHPLSEGSTLAIVCNTKNGTNKNYNYGSFSIDTEFLSDAELSEIIEMASSQNIPYRIFYDEKDFLTTLTTSNIDFSKLVVYNSAQNGIGPGRKALIPSICKYFSIRHTGSDPYKVCLCRDKFAIASLLFKSGFPVPEFYLYNDKIPNLEPNKKYIAKPLYESSSIGISKKNVFWGENIPAKYLSDLSKIMRQPLIIEEFICGFELEIPILVGSQSSFVFSPVVLHRNDNIFIGDEILDYNKIYNDDYCFSKFPENYDCTSICDVAKKVAELLELKGLCRVDFRMKKSGDFYITDVSTNPHFIQHSSVNFAFKKLGLKNSDIFSAILLLS